MRVLICSDRVGPLSSGAAGRVIAAGWSAAQTAVVPAGEAGSGFLDATAEGLGAEPVIEVAGDALVRRVARDRVAAVAVSGAVAGAGPIPYGSSSAPLGLAVADALAELPGGGTLLVDLVATDVHDGGAGLLAALGATADVSLTDGVAGLDGLSSVDASPARELLQRVSLVGVAPSTERDCRLLGLRGISSVRGRAAGDDPSGMLAADAALTRLAELLEVPDQPGAGACGGVGLAVLAVGGRLDTGPGLALAGVAGQVDLVVTGCTVFDFAERGGGVVAEAARTAERLLCPCVVLAGEVLIGGREMRTLGVEAAYALDGATTTAALTGLAARVARSWSW